MIRLCVESLGDLCPCDTINAALHTRLHYCPGAVENTSVNLTARLVNPTYAHPQPKEDTTQRFVESFTKFFRPSRFKKINLSMHT